MLDDIQKKLRDTLYSAAVRVIGDVWLYHNLLEVIVITPEFTGAIGSEETTPFSVKFKMVFVINKSDYRFEEEFTSWYTVLKTADAITTDIMTHALKAVQRERDNLQYRMDTLQQSSLAILAELIKQT